MRDNDDLNHAAERLDALWDDFVRTVPDGALTHSADDATAVSLIAYLDLLAPSIDNPARVRIRSRLFSGSRDELPTTDQLEAGIAIDGGGLIAPIPAHLRSHRRWKARINHPFVQIAATFLLTLAFLASWFVFDFGNDRPIQRGSHMVGSVSGSSTMQGAPQTDQAVGVLSVTIDGVDLDRTLIATIRRITLPSGSEWGFNTESLGVQSDHVSHYLESGSVTVGRPNANLRIFAGDEFRLRDAPLTIRSVGTEPAVFLQLIVHDVSESLPVPSSDATVEMVGEAPVQIPAEQEAEFILLRSSITQGTLPTDPSKSADQRTVFAAIESGSVQIPSSGGLSVLFGQVASVGTTGSAPAAASPTDGAELHAGDTIMVTSGSIPKAESTGSEPVTALLLNVELVDDSNPVIDLVNATWEIPADDQAVTLELREITIAPGDQLSFDLSGISLFWGVTGAVPVKLDGNPAGTIESGQIFDQLGTTAPRSIFAQSKLGVGVLTLQNPGSEPAIVIQSVVASGEGEAPSVTSDGDSSTVELIARESFNLPAGNAAINFLIENASDEESAYLNLDAQITAVYSGEMRLQRQGGEVEMHIDGQMTAMNDQPDIGATVPLDAGDWFAVAPGGVYRISKSEGADALLVSLSVRLLDPFTNPMPATTGMSEVIKVASNECRITPRTVDEFTTILADPYSEGTPQAGMRDTASTGIPADQETIDGVIATIRQVTACNAPGSYLALYSLYSANMLRYLAAFSDLTIDGIKGMADLTPTGDQSPLPGYISIENVVVFPDGRVGANAYVNGEAVYLIFVYQDGFWQIDFWDDRATIATPIP